MNFNSNLLEFNVQGTFTEAGFLTEGFFEGTYSYFADTPDTNVYVSNTGVFEVPDFEIRIYDGRANLVDILDETNSTASVILSDFSSSIPGADTYRFSTTQNTEAIPNAFFEFGSIELTFDWLDGGNTTSAPTQAPTTFQDGLFSSYAATDSWDSFIDPQSIASAEILAVDEPTSFAPLITTADSVTVPDRQSMVLDIDATDADGETEGNGLTYSLTGGVDGGSFTIDSNTGVLNFTSAPHFDNPADSNQDNIYEVEVSVSDTTGLRDTQLLDISVSDAADPVTGLEIGLYDAGSDTLITPLSEGQEVSAIAVADRNITIAASVVQDSSYFGQVESMFLDLNNGQKTRTESVEPYALFGDRQGNFFGGNIPLGENTMSFELYSENGLGGNLIDTITVNFAIA